MKIELDKIVKNVWLCERRYSISMNQEEEAAFDAVMAALNSQINDFRNKYSHLDEQDFLALALIQSATHHISENPDGVQMMEVESRISSMIKSLDEALGNRNDDENETSQ